ncbi:MAG: hypothetical protein NTW08_05425 [Gammaproteobacteria bacterium]|nr:hypothetical protein [Gammaproteobacteria bacterium]
MKFRKDLELEVKAFNVTESATLKNGLTDAETKTLNDVKAAQTQTLQHLLLLIDHVKHDEGKPQMLKGDQEALKSINYANRGMEAYIKGNLPEAKKLFIEAGNMAKEAAEKAVDHSTRNMLLGFAAVLFAVALVAVCIFVPPVGAVVLSAAVSAGTHIAAVSSAAYGLASPHIAAAGMGAYGLASAHVVATAATSVAAVATGTAVVATIAKKEAKQEALALSRATDVMSSYDNLSKRKDSKEDDKSNVTPPLKPKG